MSKNWISAELDRVYPDPESIERKSLNALLYTWQRMVSFGLKSVKTREEVLAAFLALAENRSIPDSLVHDSEQDTRVWAPAGRYYRMSNIARVRPDFSSDEDAWMFSAREGRIVGIRGGYMIIRFSDEIDGAPSEYRGRPADIEVDISHIKSEGSQ